MRKLPYTVIYKTLKDGKYRHKQIQSWHAEIAMEDFKEMHKGEDIEVIECGLGSCHWSVKKLTEYFTNLEKGENKENDKQRTNNAQSE